MMPGLIFLTSSKPSPSRSIVPGAMFSTVTSAFFSSPLTISRPRGDFRFSVSDFLLALNWWKYQGSLSGLPGCSRRPGSPVRGFSILTTSAPSQANDSVQEGPASNCVKSTPRTPARQSSSIPSIAFLPKKNRWPILSTAIGGWLCLRSFAGGEDATEDPEQGDRGADQRHPKPDEVALPGAENQDDRDARHRGCQP